MTTRPIVPRNDGEGSLGTENKKWGALHVDSIPGVNEFMVESTGTGIINGFEATISGSTINIKAGTAHMITGYRETAADTAIKPNAADTTNPRIDLIYLSSNGVVSYLEGTADIIPVIPMLPNGAQAVCCFTVVPNTNISYVTDLRRFKPSDLEYKYVDNSNHTKGSYLYTYPMIDKHQRTFGEEYLFALHKKWKESLLSNTSNPAIYVDGDSTVIGAYITDSNYLPQNVLLGSLRKNGLSAGITNKAVSGTKIQQFHLSDTDINNADCIIISFGINDTEDINQFASDYRNVLSHIRSLKSYLHLSIVIKISNAVGDTQHGRDETQAYYQRQFLRQAARDYQCFLFDTHMFIADPRNGASGEWNDNVSPSENIYPGWMDDAFRTDTNFYDRNSFGCTVHPLEMGNAWIWSRLADAICPPGTKLFSKNNFINYDSGRQQLFNETHDNYDFGISITEGKAVNGWPFNCLVINYKSSSGHCHQILHATENTTALVYIRDSVYNNVTQGWSWTAAVPIHSLSYPTYTLATGWSSQDPNFRIVNRNGAISFQGELTKASLSLGETILTITDTAALPFNETSFFTIPVCNPSNGTVIDYAAISIHKSTGIVNIAKLPSSGTMLCFDNINYLTLLATKD